MDSLLSKNSQTGEADPLRQIAALCEEFAGRRSRGAVGEFDRFLDLVGDESRDTLLRNLLQIELRCRRDSGEQPRPDEYLARYPGHADVIREEFQVFASTRLVSLVADTAIEDRHGPGELPAPSVSRLGEYLLEEELGRGAMGIVFAARHVRHGTRVALKTLPNVSGDELHRFKREFRLLANVNHPNLVGLHALQADGGKWFFTMDIVDGDDFLKYVRPGGRLNPALLRAAFAQLVIGVNALHARNIVHRDLKPSNVRVSSDGSVRLLDFGLVVNFATSEEQPEIAGTPAYMAPEQFQGQTTPASDWYAVGVMLYEALAGRLPFRGSIKQLWQSKFSSDPPPLPADAPEDLAVLCRQLLDRQPSVRPGASQILRTACQRGQDAAATLSGVAAGDRLLGRDFQLTQLEEARRSFAEHDGPQTIFISGRSGEGKTVLAEHFLNLFRQDRATILLAGRCYDRESVPFKAVDTLIDALCARLLTLNQDEVTELLTPEAAVLAELFPVLSRVPAIARLDRIPLEALELERVRALAANALRALLRGLSMKSRVVCFIDDLQWGDAASAELLLDVLRPPGAPHVLWIGTYRSDEAEVSRFLQAWTGGMPQLASRHLECKVGPLSEDECLQLVLAIVAVDTEPVRRRAVEIAGESGGNPLLLAELASCYDPRATTSQPMSIEDVLRRKLALLPAEARALLDIVSVSGQALSLAEAARTGGHASLPLSTITRMRSERLLRLVGDVEDLNVDTYHDRIREVVLREMDATHRQEWHVRLAEAIEASVQEAPDQAGEATTRVSQRVYDLAYHFFEGGDPRAFHYQLEAGDAAIRAYAMDNAIEHLRRAEQLLPEDADPKIRFRLWERLGEACGKAQRPQEALQSYRQAASVATSAIERAVAADGIGEMHHRTGHFDKAIEYFDVALREIGFRRANTLPRILLEIPWFLTLAELQWLVRRGRTEASREAAAFATNVLQRIAQIFLVRADVPRYTHTVVRIVHAALRSGQNELIARGFAKLGFNFAVSSMQMLAERMMSRAIAFAERSRNTTTQAETDGFLGITQYCLGRLEDAEQSFRKSLAVLDRVGDSWLRMAWHHHLRHIYSIRGDSDRAINEARIELQIGEALADPDTICWGEYGMADAEARQGRLESAHGHMTRALAVIQGRQSTMTECVALNHYGFVLLQSSDYSTATDVLEKSKRLTERNLLYFDYQIRAYPLLLESLVGPEWTKARRDLRIRRAKRISRWNGWLARRFPNYDSHMLRAQGRLYCATGQRQRAVRCFQKSIESARRLGADYDRARAMLDLAVVDDGRGVALRADAVAILRRLNAVIPRAECWQLGETPDEACIAPSEVPQSNCGDSFINHET